MFFQFSGPKENGPKRFCPILKDGNILTHKIDIHGLLKTPVEFCYGKGALDPLWAPRLFVSHYQILFGNIPFFQTE